jgi:hypothetical protein
LTVKGWKDHANLLIIPHSTISTLAVMVLRRAADLPIDPAHRDTRPFHTAGSILRAAQQQRASDSKNSTSAR